MPNVLLATSSMMPRFNPILSTSLSSYFGKGSKPYIRVEYKGKEKEFVSNPSFALRIKTDQFFPSQLEVTSSMVLLNLKMKETAEAYLGTTINNSVVTVLAYFNNSQDRPQMIPEPSQE